MGHFSYTCSVSGLGITGGTPVRCLLLTSSPYGDDPRTAWIVRTPPLRAVYDEYGSIGKIHKDDKFIADLWLRGLKEDLVEKGVGDNNCHDLATSKDMTFEQLLEALRAGRVVVRQEVKNFWRRPSDDSWMDKLKEKDLPMFKRIEKRLLAVDDKYTVDEPVPHVVRVRFGRYLHGEELLLGLNQAKAIVEEAGFIALIAAGSGRYPDAADLLVFNPPTKEGEDKHFQGPHWDMATGQKSADDKVLSVQMAMVREDVWQALIAYPRSQYVSLDCTACGQHNGHHNKDRQCPDKSINKRPFKKHKKGSTYTHGPVFPEGVEHLVVPNEYSEYVWFGLDAFKNGTKKTWDAIRAYFDKQERRERGEIIEEEDDGTPDTFDEGFWASVEAHHKEEAERVAALPPEEREALEAKQKASQEKWEAARQHRLANPVFGDYLITDAVPRDEQAPGSWIFRKDTPGVIGIPEHMSMCLADKLEVPALVIDQLAELSALQYAMGDVGVTWKPGASTGPQDIEWSAYVRFTESLMRIAEKEATKREEDEKGLPTTLREAIKRLKTPAKKKRK